MSAVVEENEPPTAAAARSDLSDASLGPEERSLTRSRSSDSTGSAGIFVGRVGSKRMSMNSQRSIPLPSFGFRKMSSAVPSHEPPTLLRRTGDDSAQFSQDKHLQQEENPASCSSGTIPDSPVLKSWVCKRCRSSNEKTLCASCGVDSASKEVLGIRRGTSSSPTSIDLSASPASTRSTPSSRAPPARQQSLPTPTTQSATQLLPQQPSVSPMNPFEGRVASLPTQNTFETSSAPIGTGDRTGQEHSAAPTFTPDQTHLIQHATSCVSVTSQQTPLPGYGHGQDSPYGEKSTRNPASELPTPRSSNVTLGAVLSAKQASGENSSQPETAGGLFSFWRPRRRHSLATTPDQEQVNRTRAGTAEPPRLPSLGDSPALPVRRKTAEIQPHVHPQQSNILSPPPEQGRQYYAASTSFDKSTTGLAPSSLSSVSPGAARTTGHSDASQDGVLAVSSLNISDTERTPSIALGPVKRISNFLRARRRHSMGATEDTQNDISSGESLPEQHPGTEKGRGAHQGLDQRAVGDRILI